MLVLLLVVLESPSDLDDGHPVLHEVDHDLLEAKLGDHEEEEVVVASVVSLVDCNEEQREVEVEHVEQEGLRDQGILKVLLVPVVLVLVLREGQFLVHLTEHDDEGTVYATVGVRHQLLVCGLGNHNVTVIIIFSFRGENHRSVDHDSYDDYEDNEVESEPLKPCLARRNHPLTDLLHLLGDFVESKEVLELILSLVNLRVGFVRAIPHVLDHLLLPLPALSEASSPECDR